MGDRYLLRLANGQGWEMVATDGVEPWVAKLASIMQLDHCQPNGFPKLVFMRKRSRIDWRRNPMAQLTPGPLRHFPRCGWHAHDLQSLKVWSHDKIPDMICEMGDGEGPDLDVIRMWHALAPIYNRTLESGGLPLHAALVKKNGIGALLPAPGGTGKSTCCRRMPHPWEALGDDLALLVVDRNRRYRVHPFPTWSNHLWNLSDTTWDVQQHLPLAALFFLEQSTTDEVIPIGQGHASVLITESAEQVCRAAWRNLIPEEERRRKRQLFENASALARGIPAFRLRVSLEGRFWEEMEKVF